MDRLAIPPQRARVGRKITQAYMNPHQRYYQMGQLLKFVLRRSKATAMPTFRTMQARMDPVGLVSLATGRERKG